MDINNILPIGSIVVLKEGTKKLMIYGILQSDQDDKHSEEYDYIGVPYPEGNMGQDYQYLFNTENIDKVIHRGYEDSEREDFLKRLDNYLKNE
ncbi:MAG: DUF4176 domain-containing protein [Butyrivibrio sp.]|nr:DUF4176 domain-containing protein [Butyrivibrio sp.]MBR4641003.1 DUF4176 domain-containing protein [Butyrivibrio sp.]